jgi:hypothetical protein
MVGGSLGCDVSTHMFSHIAVYSFASPESLMLSLGEVALFQQNSRCLQCTICEKEGSHNQCGRSGDRVQGSSTAFPHRRGQTGYWQGLDSKFLSSTD